MKILFTQDTDWIKRYPAQHHHIFERLCLRGHSVLVIDHEIMWKESHHGLISKRTVFEGCTRLISGAQVTVIRPGFICLPIFDCLSMLWTHYREIKRQILDFKPDLIVSQTLLTTYLSLILAKYFKIPFVFHVIDSLHTLVPYKFLKFLGKFFEKRILRQSDCVITINEILKDHAVNFGADPYKTLVIKAGVDIESYDLTNHYLELRAKYNIAQNDIVILFVGWLYHFSGLKEVSIALSQRLESSIKLWIVGQGDAEQDLRDIIAKYQLQKKVILTGSQPFRDIPHFIRASDVCILPAYNNDVMRHIVPIKIYQYMAGAKPVITTELPGIMKEFGHDHGVVYISKPEEVVQKVLNLTEHGMLASLGKKAHDFVEKYDWDQVVDQFEKALSSLIK